MTDAPLNGTTPPDPQLDALKAANQRFMTAFAHNRAPGGQFQMDGNRIMQMMLEIELLKINLTSFMNVATQSGLDPALINQAVLEQLNAHAAELEGPKILVAGRG